MLKDESLKMQLGNSRFTRPDLDRLHRAFWVAIAFDILKLILLVAVGVAD
jgi:hypothetical protein